MKKIGCQGFNGPLPSAFLDKRCVKNLPTGRQAGAKINVRGRNSKIKPENIF